MDKFDYDRQIAQKEAEIRELRTQQKTFEDLSEEQKLATMLHGMYCFANHTDQCNWGYETWERAYEDYSTRGRYLKKARHMLVVVSYDTAIQVLKALKEGD